MNFENKILSFYKISRKWSQLFDPEKLVAESINFLHTENDNDLVAWIRFEDEYTASIQASLPGKFTGIIVNPQELKSMV